MSETQKKEQEATEVLIDGKVYSLVGADSTYMQQVAAFLNETLLKVKSVKGYNHLDASYKTLLLELNLADAYFQAKQEAAVYKNEAEELEKELYALKHDMVGTKLKLESALKQQDVVEQRSEEWKKKYEALKGAEHAF